jgi:DNA topoisomerase-2
MSKHIAQTYQVLDEIEHIRKRTGMYAGSIAIQTSVEWVYDTSSKKMVKREISYIPALVKIFSEILDNAIDEGRRAPEILDTIRVTFEEDGSISVQDNGRGIPVEIHPQTKRYVAETVFSNLRAGSNFNDEEDQQLIGTNGVGSTLTNVLSTHFRVESCDGKNVLRQDFWNGMRERSEPVIKPDSKNRTKITFTPDYKFFGLAGLTDGNRLRMMKKVVDAAACNLTIKFYINGERVAVRDFDDYVALYADDFVTDNTPDWKVGISASEGFEQVSFVNSVETYQGGTHVLYVMNQITERLREHIKKKHKVEIRPSEIREHMRVYISANVNRPKFSSQTKENMISPVSDYKTSWTVPEKMINKIVKSSIIQSILDWATAKQQAEEMKELRKLNKDADKADPRRVEKFSDALEKKERHKCVLFLTEGDCLHENTSVLKYEDGSLASYPIKDVNVGDLVLTHENRLREVLSKSQKVSVGVKIVTSKGTIIASPSHRLIAYHVPTQQFIEVMAKDLTKDHKLIKNRLVDASFFSPIVSIVPIKHDSFDLEITFEAELDNPTLSTSSHRFLVWDALKAEFVLERADQLEAGRHSMVMQ